jgi:hypothetical protein
MRGLISKMIASASEEIQILLFPSSNVLEICCNEGLLSLLKEKAGAGKKNMIIRILVKKDDLIHQLIIRLFSQLENVQLLQSDSIDAKVVTMIVDKDMCLVIEMKDDLESSIAESAGLATYSNSRHNFYFFILIMVIVPLGVIVVE